MFQSHFEPYKSLKTHIEEVQAAADIILSKHTSMVRHLVERWVPLAVQFHDVGKATKAFQTYIRNPNAYRKPKETKAHTPMSSYWWLKYAFANNLEFETLIAITVAVWKHHGAFPSYDDLEACFSETWLGKQSFDPILVEQELGVPISTLTSFDFDMGDYIYRNCLSEKWDSSEDFSSAVRFRLLVQMLYSILLEADKAYLALSPPFREIYSLKDVLVFPTNSVDLFFSKRFATQLDALRTKVRHQIAKMPLYPISLVSLPTGMGKTMVAADWFLKNRVTEDGAPRKVIVVLPFLSIIDQTVKEYQNLFAQFGHGDSILESHSLAGNASFAIEDDMNDADESVQKEYDRSRDFLADTWQKPVVVTTFDQFLYSLFSSKSRHLMRFHVLADALVVMDEIQALPAPLWRLVSETFSELAKTFNTRFLIMSATQTQIFPEAKELVSDPLSIFRNQTRYQFKFRHKAPVFIEDFLNECKQRIVDEWRNKRVLLVFNTRASAKQALDALKSLGKEYLQTVYFLSGDVVPQERLEQIEDVKKGYPCLVIATQCIEAGVDIDMEVIIRDFAPFDSLIQVAGRGNRNALYDRCTIEIIRLKNSAGRCYCEMIYSRSSSLLLEKTGIVLKDLDTLNEEDIYTYICEYFNQLKDKADVGNRVAEEWAYWKAQTDVAYLLRGDQEQKWEFLVLSQDVPDPAKGELPLEEELNVALAIGNIWDRKREIRRLSGRIAKLTISVWAKIDFSPHKISRPLGHWLVLLDGLYTPREGLNISDDGIII